MPDIFLTILFGILYGNVNIYPSYTHCITLIIKQMTHAILLKHSICSNGPSINDPIFKTTIFNPPILYFLSFSGAFSPPTPQSFATLYVLNKYLSKFCFYHEYFKQYFFYIFLRRYFHIFVISFLQLFFLPPSSFIIYLSLHRITLFLDGLFFSK